ncbi:hypothetical protein HanXRQr2_Chr16g0737101 [Helianthus annuus]|uniref:Uncharacterized protein n=1 Tax=Helianthus annuus TaxID=4232 RepID=A0A9K3DS13_HELAN|nr:hypothetical protein HanXRQr2_Chr16g0737101 [Helianthus annuus]KAJ0820331.1 hypothetical protein HanPSC8_Chr16g0706671 [Helianthus annuus]
MWDVLSTCIYSYCRECKANPFNSFNCPLSSFIHNHDRFWRRYTSRL